jgi:hypothetical protein
MYLNEQIALRLGKERLADRMRAAEQLRARRRARPALRIRLGRTLVRFDHWPNSLGPEPTWRFQTRRARSG